MSKEEDLQYARAMAIELKEDIDKFLDAIGINLDRWRAAQIAVNMECQVSRIRFGIAGFFGTIDDYDEYHKAMEIQEIVKNLFTEITNKKNKIMEE